MLQPRLLPGGGYAVRADPAAIAFQAAFDLAGAYLSSVGFTVAAKALPDAALRSRSSVLFGVTITLGIYCGLAASIATAAALR